MNVISVLVVTLNSLCCVVVGLIVWFQYNPTPLATSDTNKYAVVGALQLWVVLVANAAVLATEVCSNILDNPLKFRGYVTLGSPHFWKNGAGVTSVLSLIVLELSTFIRLPDNVEHP